jgi:hypothetical protein
LFGHSCPIRLGDLTCVRAPSRRLSVRSIAASGVNLQCLAADLASLSVTTAVQMAYETMVSRETALIGGEWRGAAGDGPGGRKMVRAAGRWWGGGHPA